MTAQQCPTCKVWNERGLHAHKCPPRWLVFVHGHHNPDEPDDGLPAYGHWPDIAAAEAVDEWDDERGVLNGDVLVLVKPDGHDHPGGWFRVDAEATVNYHARQTESPDMQKREAEEP